jgi:hypothetical protein
MNRLSLLAVSMLVVLLIGLAVRAADAPETPGTIDAVTVYRGQALVTRLITIPGPAGLKEITVTNLPDQVQPGSIYAESAEGVEVRSVSYSMHPVEKDVREEVQKLDQQIRTLQDRITATQRRSQLLNEQKDYMTKLEQFTATTSSVELTKGVLNSDTLQKMTQFQFEQRSRIADDELRLGVELRTLNEQLQTLQRQRGQVATSSSKVAREAKVLVNLAAAGGKIRLRYLVDNATWLPSYNVRADAARDRVTVEYLASIQQISGEDWSNVQMTLSTATPSLVAKAPVLNELAITLARPGQAGAVDFLAQIEQSGGSEQARLDLRQQQRALENFRGTIGSNAGQSATQQPNAPAAQTAAAPSNYININGVMVNLDYIGDNNDLDLVLNKTAGDLQMVDLLGREKVVRTKDGKPAILNPEEGLAITYQLPNRTSLASRSDRQLIQITSIPLKAQFYKVASPVLATYVYDEATATNDSQTVFLYGDVATYVNNEFVGRGVMPSVAIGQRFNVGLGIDSSLRASRILVEKSETTQGGNRVVDFTYRFNLENFGSKPASVRLMDRLPTAKEAEIKVTPAAQGKDGRELSKDADYLEADRKKGILRWDLEVPAGALDTKALSFEYSFKLEYDRQMSISSPTPPAAPTTGRGTTTGGGGGFGGAGGGARGGMGGGGGAGGGARGNAAPR